MVCVDCLLLVHFRNDGIEHSYSVLINLVNQLAADGFYCSFNGKRFRPTEVSTAALVVIISISCHYYSFYHLLLALLLLLYYYYVYHYDYFFGGFVQFLRLRFAMFTLFNQWNTQSQHILQVHLLLVILNCQRVQCALVSHLGFLNFCIIENVQQLCLNTKLQNPLYLHLSLFRLTILQLVFSDKLRIL